MRKVLVCLVCGPVLFAASPAAADLSGEWKFTAPANPNGRGGRGPVETLYFFKVSGNSFTGTSVVNRGIADLVNGSVQGSHITFERIDGSGRKTAYQGDMKGEELVISLVNPPAAAPGRGGRGGVGPVTLARVSNESEYVLPADLQHKAFPPFQPIKQNGYAKTPPMGWNSWNKFHRNVNDQNVREMADAIASSGMRDAGYVYVNIDDTWEGERDKDGNITSNDKFPNMKALADYVHGKGLKLGIYSGPGTKTCAGFNASYNHEEQDAKTWAAWGIDYLKYDWCNASEVYRPEELKPAYQKMALALRAAKRPMIFSLCEYGWQEPGEWGPSAGGNLWRTTGDISDNWASMSTIGFDNQTGREKFAAPGHWNDPDMLEIGNGGMTDTEYRTHLSLWSLLAAPLLAGNDIRSMTDSIKSILTNREVIAVDQDKAGKQGAAIRRDGKCSQAGRGGQTTEIPCTEVWKRELAKGVAVALFNRGAETATIDVKWAEVGITKKSPKVRDLWRHTDLATPTGMSVQVPSHGVVMVTVQ